MGVYTGHTSITVSDMDRSLKFYCDLLGLRVSTDFGVQPAENMTGVPGSMMRFMLLASDDGLECIELFQFMNTDQRKLGEKALHEDFWSSHVAFLFDDVDAVYEKLVQSGAEVNIPLMELGGYKVAYLHDPDGYLVELIAK